jgi:hypothetical protein
LRVKEQFKQRGLAKLNFTSAWVSAFIRYAEKHHGQSPASFDQASADFDRAMSRVPDWVKADMQSTPGLTTDDFEIIYQGRLANVAKAELVVLFREKQAWRNYGGRWSRAYGFADGHSEIPSSKDGSFEAWEARHILQQSATQ